MEIPIVGHNNGSRYIVVFFLMALLVFMLKCTSHPEVRGGGGELQLGGCDESVSRGRMTGTKGRRTGTIGTKGRTEGTKERGNEKPYGLVQIEYLDRGTSTRHVWTWRGRVTLFLDV